MSRLLQNRIVFYTVCALFALAVGASFLPGRSLPVFGGGLLPESSQQLIAQSPFPPPDPEPELMIAQSPFPPPDPEPELMIAQSPFPPPDPEPELMIAQSPFPPPDPEPEVA